MKYYLICDSTNRVVESFISKAQAEAYVKERPYLKAEELDIDDTDEDESQGEPTELPF